jgi:hypothetical protein
MVNIRQDPFERTPSIGGQSLNDLGVGYMNDFFAREFLAVRSCPTVRGETRRNCDQLPADAGSGVLQPGCGEKADRRGDQEQAGTVDGESLAGGSKVPPACFWSLEGEIFHEPGSLFPVRSPARS